MSGQPWTCGACRTEQTHDAWCDSCGEMRYPSFSIQFSHHITEHLADGLSDPLAVLEAMSARPCYERFVKQQNMTLALVTRHMRLLTKDTTSLARQIAKARSSKTMLEVLETGDAKDKIAVLKGIQVLGDVVEHKGEVATVVKHVYENLPPKA
jgi:hypothetical protein